MAMKARWRRTTVGGVLLHAVALALVAVAGSDHLVVPALAGPVAAAPGLADPESEPGLADYCRIRRDLRDDPVWSVPAAAAARPAAVPPLDPALRPGLVPTYPSPAPAPASEHAPWIARRTRAPGLPSC